MKLPLIVSDIQAGPVSVSCIMPTANRRRFVEIALELFRHQDHPDRELIVVDDGDDSVEDLCRGELSVRYLRSARRMSIGAKRNLACEHARGDVIVHWDDDDWYGRDRLARQVQPIATGRADVTGLESRYTLCLADRSFWTTTRELHARMFVGDVHGGTLAYRRDYFDAGLRYPQINLAEDAVYLKRMLRSGARLERVDAERCFVYMRHTHTAWRFVPGAFLDPSGWYRTQRPPGMPEALIARYIAAAAQVRPRSRGLLTWLLGAVHFGWTEFVKHVRTRGWRLPIGTRSSE